MKLKHIRKRIIPDKSMTATTREEATLLRAVL